MLTTKQVTEIKDQLDSESPQNANPPEIDVKLFPKLLMFEVMRQPGMLFIHIYKPVEDLIRKQEASIRKRCKALYPLSTDAAERRLQLAMRDEQEKCDARRMAWRDGGGQAAWPNIAELILEAANATGLGQLDGVIEFTQRLDAWCVALKKGDAVSDVRIHRFMDEVVNRFKQLGVHWPVEIMQNQRALNL